MQTVISDTSFLFSLFGNDVHTLSARNWVSQKRLPIAISMFNRYEFQNAIRFAAFRKAISGTEVITTLDAFEADLRSGHLSRGFKPFGAPHNERRASVVRHFTCRRG